MRKKKNNKKNNKKGFTLIEMLISISLFSVVVTIAFGALMTIMDASNKAKTIKIVVNNLNLAMESMTREIRVGQNYTCGRQTYEVPGVNCETSPRDSLSLLSKDGSTNIYYSYDSSDKTIKVRKGNASNIYSLTGEDVEIEDLKFYVVGTEAGDGIQPRVFLLLKGKITRPNIESRFDIQTTISQRKIAP